MHTKKRTLSFVIATILFSFLSFAFAQGTSKEDAQKTIKAVEIKGNKAISTETIMAKIKTRAGQVYYAQTSRDDIKRLYETGFFSDISLELEDVEGGVKVVFKLEERPLIEEIVIQGNKALSRAAILRKLKIKVGQYLNLSVLNEDIAAVKKEYERVG
ncbi:MAG TPA: POTRA domain-containing protein, partial [Candidatus Omnitrophota bacterium]|nr:POTRA domain-containing protein [Candidatus Omnitrophota bacterium]